MVLIDIQLCAKAAGVAHRIAAAVVAARTIAHGRNEQNLLVIEHPPHL